MSLIIRKRINILKEALNKKEASLHGASDYPMDPDTRKALFAISEALNNIETFVNLSLAAESWETLNRLDKTLDDIEKKISELKAAGL